MAQAHEHPPVQGLQKESQMDYAAHQHTYDSFVKLVKWGIMGLAVILVLLYFIVRP